MLTLLQKLPKNVEDLGKLIVATKALKNCPKSNKLPNLITLALVGKAILQHRPFHRCILEVHQ